MSKQYFLALDGIITANQPLTTNPPSQSSSSAAKEPTRLPKMMMQIDGIRGTFPYFPAAGIKGKLRRSAVDVVRDQIIKDTGNDKPFNLATHYFLSIGGVLSKGATEDDARDPEKDKKVRAINPLVSLFGAGFPFIAGRVSVGHALPIESFEPLVIKGVRSHDLSRNPEGVEYLEAGSVDLFFQSSILSGKKSKLVSQGKALEQSMKRAAKDDKEAFREKLAENKKLVEAVEAELTEIGSSTVAVGQLLDGYEAMPIGTQLSHQITGRNMSIEEIGLLLLSLEQFALDPVLGGHIGNGSGEVSVKYTLKIREKSERQFSEVGQINIVPFSGMEISDESGFVSTSIDAFNKKFGDYDFNAGAHITKKEVASEDDVVKPVGKNKKAKGATADE